MRRQIDDLFGDFWERAGLGPRQSGFRPAADVYYCGDPPMAVVEAELAGIDPSDLGLEIRGRELVLAGRRSMKDDTRRRAYQQVEVERGPFRRVIALGADVVADDARAVYEDGILRVELPLARPERQTRTVPVEVARATEDQ